MNFIELGKQFLNSIGMPDSQINSIMDIYSKHDISKEIHHRLKDEIDGYPVVLQNLVIATVKRVALEWVDNNTPKAWFRPMLTPDPEKTLKEMGM